jgi:hypothetical protein
VRGLREPAREEFYEKHLEPNLSLAFGSFPKLGTASD